MMSSSIKRICSFFSKRKCVRKIFIVLVTLSGLNKTSNRPATSGVFKWRRARHLPRAPSFWPTPLGCYTHKCSLFLMKNLLFTHIMYYKADHK